MYIAPSTTAPHGLSLQLLLHRTLSVSQMLHLCIHSLIYRHYIYTESNIHVYWYMEADTCGVRGVMRMAHIDMRISSVNCPAPLTQYQLDSGESNVSTKTELETCDLPYHHFTSITRYSTCWKYPRFPFPWAVCMCITSTFLMFT